MLIHYDKYGRDVNYSRIIIDEICSIKIDGTFYFNAN